MIDTEVARTFDRRSALFLTGGAVLTSFLILRMLQMQVFEHKDYSRKSENNSFRIQSTMAKRGDILSKSGSVISHDERIYRIYLIPEEIDDIDYVIKTVSKDLKLSKKRIEKIWKTIKKQRGFQPVLISENTNWDTLAKIVAKNIPGIHIDTGFSRIYDMGPAGAQIFGYVGVPKRNPNNTPFYTTGITGMENKFNDVLSGTEGQTVFITNAVGRVTGEDESQFIASTPGKNLKTTIRDDIQKVLYDALTMNRAGAGVVLDIETGEILAMASTPSFDPNKFKTDDGEEYMASLNSDMAKPFMNKTIEGLYPPGSTFKIIVALAALESGAITPYEEINCPGHWELGDHKYHCWKKEGHGKVNLEKALKYSCDVYFYQVALRIGINAIRNMAIKMGLSQKYLDDVLSRESIGLIPTKAWKEKNIGQSWVRGDTVISGIGQGYILANCLQLAVMIARTVSNKEVVPHLIYTKNKPNFKNLGIREKNIRSVLNGLEQVTKQGGTAAASAINVNGKKMGGKTGTSQVRNISIKERETGVLTTEQLKWNLRNHGLFVGYAPINKPKYATCVIIEHAGGSGPAAEVSAQVLKELLK